MPSEAASDHYSQPDVVASYADARDAGLTDRERRVIDRHFDPSGRVLDLGCGAGRTSTVLEELGYDTVALDVSRPMLANASEADPDVRYVAADAAALPFTDESVRNILFSHNGLDQLRPESKCVAAMREIHRVMEPEGRFAFSTHNLLRWLLPFPPTRHWLGKLLRFWRRNAREGRIGSSYKRLESDPPTQFTDPLSVWRLVRAVGFECVELVGTGTPGSKLLSNSVFAVVRKPNRGRFRRQ